MLATMLVDLDHLAADPLSTLKGAALGFICCTAGLQSVCTWLPCLCRGFGWLARDWLFTWDSMDLTVYESNVSADGRYLTTLEEA